MAIYRTDRDRRILGDRVVANQDAFNGIHSAVGEVHGLFCEAHVVLAGALEERRREETEDGLARNERERAVEEVGKMYGWAYHQVEGLLQPSWDAVDASEDATSVRARLFPLGPPTAASVSTQLILDGMTHFLAATEREKAVAYPEAFIQSAGEALAALGEATAKVTVEIGETSAMIDTVTAARERWDICYESLRDMTAGFLRLSGEEDRVTVLFRDLPSSGASKTDAENGNALPAQA